MFFRPKQQRNAAMAGQLPLKNRSQSGQRYDPLLGFAIGQRASANDESAGCHCIGKRGRLLGILKQFRRTNRRASLAPMRCGLRGDRQVRKPEVRHRTRSRSDVQGIARRDENHLDTIALGFSQQELIVERRVSIERHPVGTLGLRMGPDTQSLQSEAEALCATARWCYGRGWAPATSGNFSVRDLATGHILISTSGFDKGTITIADLLQIDSEGRVLEGSGKPSAETSLHQVIYRHRSDAGAILHVHSIWNTLLSARFAPVGYVPIEGYELLKGLSGVETHAYLEQVPILENSQNYQTLSSQLTDALAKYAQAHGVLLSRHGLYTWGKSVADARRHLEALEFLFEVEGRRLMGGQA